MHISAAGGISGWSSIILKSVSEPPLRGLLAFETGRIDAPRPAQYQNCFDGNYYRETILESFSGLVFLGFSSARMRYPHVHTVLSQKDTGSPQADPRWRCDSAQARAYEAVLENQSRVYKFVTMC